MERRLIAALAVSLGGALLVIAFLAGRLTSHNSVPVPQAPNDARQETPQAPVAPVVISAATVPAEPSPTAIPETERLSSPPPGLPVTPPHQPETDAISAYFAKIDAIQVAGSGDPSVFAQGIIGGLEQGDRSGIDSLVNGSKLALAQASAVQPPPPCEDYHRLLLEALSETSAKLIQIRNSIDTGDTNAIIALAPQLQATQQKVDYLDRMRKQLLRQ